ncbi:S8 family serine peptidase [Streptomyces sp. NPDC002454]
MTLRACFRLRIAFVVLVTSALVPLATPVARSGPVAPLDRVQMDGLRNGLPIEGLVVTYHPGSTVAAGDLAAVQRSLPEAGGGVRLIVREWAGKGHAVVDTDPRVLTRSQWKRVMLRIAGDAQVREVGLHHRIADPHGLRQAGPGRRPVQEKRERVAFVPNDHLYGQQWALQPNAGVKVPEVWGAAQFGAGARVAVIDGGVVPHPDLPGVGDLGADFIYDWRNSRRWNHQVPNARGPGAWDPGDWIDQNTYCYNPPQQGVRNSTWHGTIVTGIIDAVMDNGIGIAGMAPAADVIPIRVSGPCGLSAVDLTQAIYWAAGVPSDPQVGSPPAGVDVINLSLNSVAYGMQCPPHLQDALQFAYDRGITVVNSAGNDNRLASGYFPANCGVPLIVVAGVDRHNLKSPESNFGDYRDNSAPVDVAGPGTDVLSTTNSGHQGWVDDTQVGGVYVARDGTSFAAPHVSALAALLIGRYPQQLRNHPDVVSQYITAIGRVTPLPYSEDPNRWCTDGNLRRCGSGMINAWAAMS